MLGGTQSLHTDGFDEALALPTEDAARIALQTQQILAYESGVANTVDPLGGSYFVERLTKDMEDGAFAYFDKLDTMGGMVKAIEIGFPQKEIAEASYAYQRAVEKKEKIIVGVNEYTIEETPQEILYIGEEARIQQTEKLKRLLATVRRNGYATMNTAYSDVSYNGAASAVGLPILINGLAVGSLNFMYLRSSIEEADAVAIEMKGDRA